MESVPTTTLSDHHCHLGEGAAYDRASDTAWWFDILERKLFEARLGGGELRVHELPFTASHLSFVEDGVQLVFAEDGLYRREVDTGRLMLVVSLEAGNRVTRCNDGRAHPSGALWAGTMGREAEKGAGAIYWFRAGELRRLFDNLTIPNAISFTADGRTGYFADTKAGTVMRVALDPESGLPVAEPETFLSAGHGEGEPDGAVVDADGLFWSARFGGGCVEVYAPSGERVRSLAVPARQVTCPAFVGRALDRLMVTTACENMSEAEKRADPEHGRTFILDVGARGLPDARVRLRSE